MKHDLVTECDLNFFVDDNRQCIYMRHSSFFLRNKLWLIFNYLQKAEGQAVTRLELCKAAWSDYDHNGCKNLSNAIHSLRKKFKEHNFGFKIVTIHKKGYAMKAIKRDYNVDVQHH